MNTVVKIIAFLGAVASIGTGIAYWSNPKQVDEFVILLAIILGSLGAAIYSYFRAQTAVWDLKLAEKQMLSQAEEISLLREDVAVDPQSDDAILKETIKSLNHWAGLSAKLKIDGYQLFPKETVNLRDTESINLGVHLSLFTKILEGSLGGKLALSIKRVEGSPEPIEDWRVITIARDSESEKYRREVGRDFSTVGRNDDLKAIFIEGKKYFKSSNTKSIDLDRKKIPYSQMITYPIPDIAFTKNTSEPSNRYLLCVDNAGDKGKVYFQSDYALVAEDKFGLALTQVLANEFSVPMMYLEELPGSRSFREYGFSLSKIQGWWINIAFLKDSREFLHITVLQVVGAEFTGYTFKPSSKKLKFMGRFDSLMVRAQSRNKLHIAYKKSATPADNYFHSLEYQFESYPIMEGRIRTIAVDKKSMSIKRSPDEIVLRGRHIYDDALVSALEGVCDGIHTVAQPESEQLLSQAANEIALEYDVDMFAGKQQSE